MSPETERLHLVPYITAENAIHSADVLLFRSGKRKDLIAIAGRTDYSHAGLAVWWNNADVSKDRLLCLDTAAFRGGSHTLLSRMVEERPGQIDVYAPAIPVDVDAIAAKMVEITGDRYGWWGLFKVSWLHIPIVRFFAKPNLDDEANGTPPFCSDAVARAYRLGGEIDLVPNLADKCTEPGDLARSALLAYKFTLI